MLLCNLFNLLLTYYTWVGNQRTQLIMCLFLKVAVLLSVGHTFRLL